MNSQYSDFIKEAFIDPIRSVLIVDDDYPTYDEILDRQIEDLADDDPSSSKKWLSEPVDIKKVIGKFRNSHRSLSVDIHDGSNLDLDDEAASALQLHQSDLLVLDYELDKSRKGDGTKAINILRNVMSNEHFNLIVVHTRENVDNVFKDMLVGLLGPEESLQNMSNDPSISDLLDDAEEEHAEASDLLRKSIGDEQYLYFRANINPTLFIKSDDNPNDKPSFDEFNDLCVKCKWVDDDIQKLFYWALSEREKALTPHMNQSCSLASSWSHGEFKWIRSDSGFVSFLEKQSNDGDILDHLLDALSSWRPKPSRLFLTKMRAQIEKFGVAAESRALGNNHVLAYWYNRLLKEEGAAREYYVEESISRHADQLLDFVRPEVKKFAINMVMADSKDGKPTEEICKTYFDIDLEDNKAIGQAKSEHNAFVCSKKIEGYHLTTGHVFKIDENYWVCLTPACDLVPGQNKNSEIGNTLPFLGVKLVPYTLPANQNHHKRWHKKFGSNRFISLNFENEIKSFCLNDPDNEGASPTVSNMYAMNLGKFDAGNNSFSLQLIEADTESKLLPREYKAELVSQLRYEYAINLMQKLGISMTRIGLDFAG